MPNFSLGVGIFGSPHIHNVPSQDYLPISTDHENKTTQMQLVAAILSYAQFLVISGATYFHSKGWTSIELNQTTVDGIM